MGFFILLSCRPAATVFPPEWQRSLTISNSARAFKITLGWKRSEKDSTRAIFYVAHINPSTDFLDYRENNTLRAGMLDTLELAQDLSTDLFEWTKAKDWKAMDHNTVSEGTGDQFVMAFNGGDQISFVGMPVDKDKRRFIEWAIQLFESSFPKLGFEQSEIVLTLSDRVHGRIDSIRFVHNQEGVTMFDGREVKLPLTEYLELWRILEKYKVMELPSDSSYAVTYPMDYHLKATRDGRSAEWTVFAPSKLSDKRYYYIVNAIETAGVFHPAW